MALKYLLEIVHVEGLPLWCEETNGERAHILTSVVINYILPLNNNLVSQLKLYISKDVEHVDQCSIQT